MASLIGEGDKLSYGYFFSYKDSMCTTSPSLQSKLGTESLSLTLIEGRGLYTGYFDETM